MEGLRSEEERQHDWKYGSQVPKPPEKEGWPTWQYVVEGWPNACEEEQGWILDALLYEANRKREAERENNNQL